MPDLITMLEDEMELLYDRKKDEIARASHVADWADYMFRAGFLAAIRETGQIIKKIRNPKAVENDGEIPSILDTKETRNDQA